MQKADEDPGRGQQITPLWSDLDSRLCCGVSSEDTDGFIEVIFSDCLRKQHPGKIRGLIIAKLKLRYN